ncbi:hypothetical protein B0T14DRAFT_26895 [Immersiella caudata]|uniref:Uncharacterized protein n=1 Tax=Immersiella caudata TaxID=314043 RepID=A0AA40CBF8_9PEZI|nr:hypothetical protein B0T14DRAFT_26895 [Immersiella caudata]
MAICLLSRKTWLAKGYSPFTRERGNTLHEISEAQLLILSDRDYCARVSDPMDFPSVWESMIPILSTLLSGNIDGDFTVNVFSYSKMKDEAIHSTLKQKFATEFTAMIPPTFNPIYLRFGQGRQEGCDRRHVRSSQLLNHPFDMFL